jgi:hypothetical protein
VNKLGWAMIKLSQKQAALAILLLLGTGFLFIAIARILIKKDFNSGTYVCLLTAFAFEVRPA